jgi:exonuclease SbcC
MILHSLRLRGVLRFDDEVRLDCRELPGGLIALTGPNGEGKTAVMEAPIATLYRTFPSRAKKEPFDYATRKDAFMETVFELEGRGLYRARLNLDHLSRKADAVLYHVAADGKETPLSDGKLASYEAAIAHLLPSLSALLVSVYAAQDRTGSFARLEKKDRRTLFGSLCGCDHYEEMAERARLAAARLTDAIERHETTRAALARDAGPDVEEALERRAQQLQVDAGAVECRRAELARQLGDTEAALAAVQEQANAYAAAHATHDRVTADLAARHRERDRLTQAFKQADLDVAAAERRLTERLTATLNEAARQITATRTILEHADAIHAAVATVAEIDAALVDATREQEQLQDQRQRLVVREREQERALAEIDQAERDFARVTDDTAILGTVPCGGAGAYARCDFLTNAQTAKARIPAFERVIATRPAYAAGLLTVREEITALEVRRQHLRARVAQLSTDKQAQAAIAKQAAPLAAATARIAGLEQQQRDATASTERERAELQARARQQYEGFAAQGEEVRRTIDALKSELGAALTRLQATEAASTQAAEYSALLSAYRREWDDTTARLATVQAQVAELQTRRAQLAARRQELDALDVTLAFLRTEVVEWNLYAKVFGREGLPTLEIDAAGPTVAAYCNQLLEACYGGRFTVDLVTQVAKRKASKNGTTEKDTFELTIYDAQRAGAARDLTDLSGGEQVVVEEAFRSAIALMVNARNEQPIRTCWRDESMGALHAEAVPHYMAVLRKVQEVGRFQHLFYVTHNVDAQLYADAQLVFGGGAITVEQPPYAGVVE